MAEKSSKGSKGVALAKRAKIDSAQRNMFIAVMLASIVLGVTIVGTIYLIRMIIFNNDVSAAKDGVIEEYKKAQKSLSELTVKVSDLSKNDKLEVMARTTSRMCDNYSASEDEDWTHMSSERVNLARTCSSLRVISDALPAIYNLDSTRASMNEILRLSNGETGVGIESVTGEKGRVSTVGTGLTNIGGATVSINLLDEASRIRGAMDMIENSIRNFDITAATINWQGDDIQFKATYAAYYSESAEIHKATKLVCADDTSDACKKAKGSIK